jgi:protocatechuate 3,4-dioxygenase beta subunit
LAGAITRVEAHERVRASPVMSPTPWNDIGPFYKRRAPRNPQLRAANGPGLPIAVSGRVLDTRGRPIPQAILQVWQADHRGIYDLDGYRYRATLTTDSEGRYVFQSVMPGTRPRARVPAYPL